MLRVDRVQIYVQYKHDVFKKHEYSGLVITKATPKSLSKYSYWLVLRACS
jgi:hypothetical protein